MLTSLKRVTQYLTGVQLAAYAGRASASMNSHRAVVPKLTRSAILAGVPDKLDAQPLCKAPLRLDAAMSPNKLYERSANTYISSNHNEARGGGTIRIRQSTASDDEWKRYFQSLPDQKARFSELLTLVEKYVDEDYVGEYLEKAVNMAMN
ncbi:hypothetical protein NMY22_g16284 [Coprinellus aureogranulatus]|nr:hypothetical protein NMY22_g16284 [Coprinellus aureogranulatus]